MRLNRRATFCLGITRQNIDRRIHPQEGHAYSRSNRVRGLAGPPNARILRGRADLFDDMIARTAFPIVVPASKSVERGRRSRGSV